MRFSSTFRVGLSSIVAAVLSLAGSLQGTAGGQTCPITFPPSPGNDLSAYVTTYPGYVIGLGSNQPLSSTFIVDVTNIVNHTNYPAPPIPYGLYHAWCVDQYTLIDANAITIPGTLFTGALYSTCDPNLNLELPPGHPNTIVPPANWQMVNYILNHHSFNHTNAFYWDIQTAINTLVGSGVGGPDGCGSILHTPTPSGLCGYPTNHPLVVSSLLNAASNNAATWTPQCGDVYGVVYVTSLLAPTNQFLLVEVPVCPGAIGVTKQVACLQPTNECGTFGPIATGYLGTNEPAFCYQITITNPGDIPLTNIVVSDNLLGVLSAQFTNFLAPGASSTAYFKMAFAANATNTVTVVGDAFLSHPVTNGDTIIANGTPFTASASAIALVQPAQLACSMTLTSSLDLSNGINPNVVYLPSASIYSTPPVVNFSVTVYNLSATATITNITLTSDALTALGCTMPAPFSLLPGKSATFTAFCSETVPCPGETLSISAGGKVMPGGPVCGDYDLTSTNLIGVTTGCGGTITCVPPGTGGNCGGVGSLSGNVYLHCDGTMPVSTTGSPLPGDSALSGATVTLLTADLTTTLATTSTDNNGYYTFNGLAAGNYVVQVTPPANYSETFPTVGGNSQVQVTIVPCNNVQNFGYADNSPVIVNIPPGGNLGCNPVLPTVADVQSTVTASDDRGPLPASAMTVTESSTTNGCVVTMIFTATATGTCGTQGSDSATYTWSLNQAPLVLGNVSAGGDLGCNPTSLPTDSMATNGVTVPLLCSATLTNFSVSHTDVPNACGMTRTYTITAADSCGNTGSATVVYTWTLNVAPLVLANVPTGTDLGCNPTSLPTDSMATNGVTVPLLCSATLTSFGVTSADVTAGCVVTRTYTITATDSCHNTGTATVVYTWTVNVAPLVLANVPTGTDLGCNPTSCPTDSMATNGVTVPLLCSATLTSFGVTSADVTAGCVVTRTYTITAHDSCGNTGTATVVYTWTINVAPLVLGNVPTGTDLGCNPTSFPTDSMATNGVTVPLLCSATLTSFGVTSADVTSGCVVTRTYTITATDSCGNHGSATVVYTWSLNSAPLALANVPAGGDLGCNPTSYPTDSMATNGVTVPLLCSATLTSFGVTSADVTSGCVVTRTYTITATDSCHNTGTATVVYTWTINNTPLALAHVPAGSDLGCNPTSLPTDSMATNGVTVPLLCSATLTSFGVTSADVTSGCIVTRTYTITATDSCHNTGTATVVYTWTINVAPLVLANVPTGTDLGCNPTSLPTDSMATNGVTVPLLCSATLTSFGVTSADVTAGCVVTRTYTITATDSCHNTGTATVVYTWTVNVAPLVLANVPTGTDLGCNPTSLPTDSTVTNGVTVPLLCSATLTSFGVTSADVTSGCVVTRTYTITATDSCHNTGTATVVYTWTINNTPLALAHVPAGSDLGCNPASLPTDSMATNGVTVPLLCSATLTSFIVGHNDVTSGCIVTRTYTITATDSCHNTGTATVVYTWTVNNTPLALAHVPAGTSLGCNPTSLPTDSMATNGVTVPLLCSATLSTFGVTHADVTSGCTVTRTYTITATDSCHNTGTAHVVYTWTINNTPLALAHVPAGGNLGCNPTLPTDNAATNGVTVPLLCSAALTSFGVTHNDVTSGCLVTRTYTITAHDSCGNAGTATVVYTWTVDTTPPALSGLPSGGNLGNNPTILPTITSISNMVHVTDLCGSSSFAVTNVDVISGCTTTRTFAVTGTDACGNHATATVTYTWTSGTILAVVCPANLTIATNFTPIYCTFTPSDWNSSCNGQGTTPTWWTTWDQQNHGYNCNGSWTNWWTSCTGSNPGSNCWSFCQNQQSGNNGSRWWGASCNASSAPSWCSSWNFGNPNQNWWVPCNGLNPGSVLTNCFGAVYSNHCVRIGLTNSNCYTFTSCNAIRQCLSFTGSGGSLNNCATNPTSCGAGNFCAQVLALQLNCDFGDAGSSSSFGGPCGDLIYNDPSSPCHGQKVRDICKTANCVLGGGSAPAGCTASYLCGLCSNLNQCFEGCQVSSWCHSHLSPVYIPTPSVSGTATVVTNACTGPVCLTYRDSVASGACSGSYVITRTWIATTTQGASNCCEQTITVTASPGPSISGNIVNDCAGVGCSSGNNYGWNNYGWNYWGWNQPQTPDFSSESGLTGVTVTLKNSSGTVIGTTTTDTDGGFTFPNPGTGTYTVVVTPPAGYTLSYPTTGTANQATVTVTSACQTICNLQFAYAGNQTSLVFIKTGPTNAACGQNITYTFAVTNTGNNCVQLSVIDPLLGGQIFSQNSVAPGQGFLFTKCYTTQSKDIGHLTNTAWAINNPPVGPNVTNYSSTVASVTTKACTNSITCSFNSQMPSSGWLWCNSHISCGPHEQASIHCENATVTIVGHSGRTYTYAVPDCDINFSSSCTSASSSFDGRKWHTTLPTLGDDEIFLAGCPIPCNSDFAGAHSVTWTGVFTCDQPGLSFNWQWGAACYNSSTPQCGTVQVKACHQTSCGYNNNSGDHAGTLENQKSGCIGGGTGGGGSNWTGSWSSTGSCTLSSCN